MLNINEEELQCKICCEFLVETVLCTKCSNAFCKACAINYKKKAKKYGRVDKCPICGEKNFTFQRCEEIDKLVKKRKQKPLQCAHCKRIIFDKDDYETHIETCKYQCKFCENYFDKEDDLLRHIKKNYNELIKSLELMNLNKNTSNRASLKPKKIIKKKILKKKKKNTNTNTTNNFQNSEIKINTDADYQIISDITPYKKRTMTAIKKKKTIITNKSSRNNRTIDRNDQENSSTNIYKSTNFTNKIMNKLSCNLSTKPEKIHKKIYNKVTTINKMPTINSAQYNINNNMKNYLINTEHKNSFINTESSIKTEMSDRNKSAKLFKSVTTMSDKKKLNDEIFEEEEGINKYVDYLNDPVPISQFPENIPDNLKYYKEYDLFFCGKQNDIDCICCKDHICKPGNCMCLICMKINKKYHKLKSHYLINKAGRACKYSHGSFHCYSNYLHVVNDIVNNVFKPIYRCHGRNVCKPCQEITLLMEQYLTPGICQKLRDREQNHF